MKKYKRKYKKRMIKIIFLQLLLILIVIMCGKSFYSMAEPEQDASGSPLPSTALLSVDRTKSDKNASAELNPLTDKELTSHNAVLIRLKDKKTLLDKKSEETIYPASLTKIMTAIVAIENMDDLKQPVTLSSDLFQALYDEDASMAGFKPEETVSAIDLLYGVLLPSGAECCIGLCDYIAGTEDAFVDQMNEKAVELGMSHTHFTNSTGLTDSEHYSSVEDLAHLLEYALQNDTFRDIFTSSRHTTDPTNLHPDGITFYSTMFEKMSSADFNGGSVLGGKTGYTSEAGLCLASLAKIDGEEYILVTAGAKGDHDTEQYNIKDALMVYKSLN